MQRTVTLTIMVPNDHADSPEEVTMLTKFNPPLRPNEACISAMIVNTLLNAFEGKEVTIV